MKTPEEMAEEYGNTTLKDQVGFDLDECRWEHIANWEERAFLAGYHTGYNIAYELGFEEALKAQKTLTYIQAEIKKNNENS